MAKNKHTFAKRQREIEKKRKAEEKIAKRRAKNRPPEEADQSAELDASDATPAGLPDSSTP